MKNFILFSAFLLTVACATIDQETPDPQEETETADLNLQKLARIFADLPIDDNHIQEVYDAVVSSSGRGYDEEYTLDCLLTEPGSGVGTQSGTKTGKQYSNPLRNLIRDYFEQHPTTKGSVEQMLIQLAKSDYQLYWPYHENWDGYSYPIITFDPGYGAQSNYGYAISCQSDGTRIVDSVYVDEKVAVKRPVWVINSNTDAGFTPLELFENPGGLKSAPMSRRRTLTMKSFRMLRNYDSWFGGASEFWIKCGSVEGFNASTEAELKLYSPSVTDFLIVVKRKDLGKELPYDVVMVSDFSSQLDKIAFMITEDDGGTRSSWKCQAAVKIKSKSYGIEVDLPLNQKDDIVWRGQLSARYFEEEDVVSGRFGDVIVSFELN